MCLRGSKYFEPPLKYLDHVCSACCSRVVNCTKNWRARFVRSWDDILLTRCHEPAYKLRLSLPEPHTCQSRGARWKRTQWNTTTFLTLQSTTVCMMAVLPVDINACGSYAKQTHCQSLPCSAIDLTSAANPTSRKKSKVQNDLYSLSVAAKERILSPTAWLTDDIIEAAQYLW